MNAASGTPTVTAKDDRRGALKCAYNLMIKSQIQSDSPALYTAPLPSVSNAPLVQRTRGEDAPKLHAISHVARVLSGVAGAESLSWT
jgi:hypothetical protein